MIITVHEIPLSKNQWINMGCKKFNARLAKRREYKDRIGWLILAEVANRKRPKYKRARVTFDIYFKTKRRRDTQNYSGGGLIAWLDVLVDQNIIADDCYDVIGQPLVNFYIDKANPRTEIEIKEMKG